MLKPGSRIAGFEVIEVLGHGRSAITYRARDLKEDRDVAIKIPHARLLEDSKFYFRFLREAALGARLKHRAIVRVLTSGEEDDVPYIVMELAYGTPLNVELSKRGPLELKLGLGIAREIADALAYADSHGVVHRNLKPGHLMLLADGGVMIMDFGVARDYGQVGLTESKVFLGTPLYAPPEANDPRSLDHRSDLYSLGVILFEMLQGHPPYEAASPVQIMLKHDEEPFPSRGSLDVPVPPAVWELNERLCRKAPGQRPPKGTDVVREIDRILGILSRRSG